MVQVVTPFTKDAQLEAARTPPHSIEAEQSVLGGLLLDNVAWDRIGDVITEADFYRGDHRTIFQHIAKLIELNNHLTSVASKLGGTPRAIAEPFVLLLAPLAPHVAEELWASFGATASLAEAPFPTADPALLVEDTVELPVSINGKVRARITVASDADEATVRAAALAEPNVLAHLGGSAPKKLIVVAGRMVNIVM